jgi:hypothetical protein
MGEAARVAMRDREGSHRRGAHARALRTRPRGRGSVGVGLSLENKDARLAAICRMETAPTHLMSAEELRTDFEGSITELLRNREGTRVDHAVAEVDAAAANPETAAALNVSVGAHSPC